MAKKSGAEVAGAFIGIVIIFTCLLAFNAWILMLLWGALHSAIGWPTFTISYWEAVIVTVCLQFIGGFFKSLK